MSSDSDDDVYGNVTERLQKLKDQFNAKQSETVSLYDDSAELDEIVKNTVLAAKNKGKSGKKNSKSTPDCSVSDISSISIDELVNNSTKRVTRSAARNSGVSVPDSVPLQPSRARTQRDSAPTTTSDTTNSSSGNTTRSSSRGRRGRGRGSPRCRGRGRRNRQQIYDFLQGYSQQSSMDPSIPVYSVGNTDEYPDDLHSQPIFKSNEKKDSDEEVIFEDLDTNLDLNEEYSVKVYWQSSEVFKFTIRKFQKFTQIFDYFAKKQNVAKDKLLFTYQDKIVYPDDSPDSIDYNDVKFIEGGIVTQGVSDWVTKPKVIENGITVKFQCQKLKKPFEVTIGMDDKLSLAYVKFAEHIEIPMDKLRFDFDGDGITGRLTPREMDFEGGECFDVRILS